MKPALEEQIKIPHSKTITAHFERSEQFYYIIVSQQGNLLYTNSFFQRHFIDHLDYVGLFPAGTLDESETLKYYRIIQQCLESPEVTVRARLKLTQKDHSLALVQWEFSSFINEDGIVEDIFAIGMPVLGQNQGNEQDTRKPTSKDELRQSELFYRNLISDALDGMLLTDENGLINFASSSITRILGYEPRELQGRSAFEYVHPADKTLAYTAFIDEVKETPRVKFIAVRLLKKSGEWIWCMIRGHNLTNNPHVGRMVIYLYDDTLRKEAEDALIESENRFRGLIHNLRQGVVVQSADAKVMIYNPAALQMLGLSEDELMGATSYDPRWKAVRENGQDFPVAERPIPLAFRTKKPVRDVVMGVIRYSTNERVWLLINADPIIDSEENVVNVICSLTDITEQKKLSQELIEQEIQKQKQLVQATIDGQEKERREIGKELHDNISQHLTTMRLYLEVIKEKASGETFEMINLAYKGLTSIIHEIRQLSQSLVPPTLGDLGLIDSVRDLCNAIKRAHTFNIDFYHRYFNEEEMPGNLKLMLFRITQEQINNIIRHAGANTILIRLQSDAEYITLVITDNGRGFDPDNYTKGLGFTNIINRASLFNGKTDIQSSLGGGCQLTVTIPKV